MDKNEVTDILKAAEKYVKKLENLDENIKRAENQIFVSGNESLCNIETIFNTLKNTVINALDARKLQLENDIKKVQTNGIKPLRECQDVISEKIQKTNELITQGNKILDKSLQICDRNEKNFYLQSGKLGNLPAVPSLVEVPYINFTSANNVQHEIVALCNNFGMIFNHSPVHINALIPKPGGILIQWEENESIDERLISIHEFRLQYTLGDLLQNPQHPVNFQDCYSGSSSEYLKKDLKLNQPYSFRVCCKMDLSVEWSPWSLPQVSKTDVEPFCWQQEQPCYALNDGGKLATKTGEGAAVLKSAGAQFKTGYSVEFTILDIDDQISSNITGIGLCDEPDIDSLNPENHQKLNTFLVSSNGVLYIAGKEKSTRLPPLKKGSKICFTCEEVNDKMRIYVESEEKNVTYDWKVGNNGDMYFFVVSDMRNFKILVE